MKKGTMGKMLPVLLLTLAVILLPAAAHAATKLTVNPDPAQGGKDIRAALLEAKENASAGNPYEITIAPGTYRLNVELPIYSYTTLNMSGVTLIRTNGDYNMLRVGDKYNIEKAEGDKGYCYKDIRLVGGTWDGAGLKATMLKFAHARNVTLDGVTAHSITDGHIIEVAATDGFTCRKCTFRDQKVKKRDVGGEDKHTCYEAIQVDVLIKGHFKGYRAEAMPVTNVLIDGCTFSDMPRGVGSHTGWINMPHRNITVKNCTFNNMGSCGVQFMYCADVTVKDNVITNSPRGIAIYGVMPEAGMKSPGLYRPSAIESSASEAYTEGQLKNYTITGNKISLDGEDKLAGYDPLGIVCYGTTVITSEKEEDGSGGIPAGNYYISNAVVTGNEISGRGYGVRFFNTRDSEIQENGIIGEIENDKKEFYAINIKNGCQDLTIANNTIKNSDSNGIYLMDSSVKEIRENTVENTGKYGIALEDNAKAEKITNNTVSGTKHTGISLLNKCTSDSITGNTVKDTGKHGILLEQSSVKTLSNNTFTGCGAGGADGIGIYLYKKSTAGTVSGNKISSTGKYGIALDSNSSVTNLTYNTIKDTNHTGISLLNECKAQNITENTVTKAAKHGLLVEKSTADSIMGNKISETGIGGNGIYIFNESTSTSILSNTVSKTRKYGIAVEKSKAAKIEKNKVSNTGHTGISLLDECTSDSITKNTVTNVKKHGIFLEGSTVKNISNNVIKNTAAKRRGNGIYLLKGCKAASITGNKVSNTDKYGIALEQSEAEKIVKNTVSNTGHTGISLLKKCTSDSITKNTVTNVKKHGISLAKNCKAESVLGNKISGVPAGGRAVNCDSTSKITKRQAR